mgnify:CR=1 FL=1
MKITFDEALNNAHHTSLEDLHKKATDKTALKKALDWMQKNRFVADIDRGITRSCDGVQSQFCDYFWQSFYRESPHWIFYDYFMGIVLNKYSRIVRGIDK